LDFFFDEMAMRRPLPAARLHGFTLIELMLVLGVMTIIATGVLMLARHVDTSRRVEQETARVQSIFSGLDSAYANAADFGTDLTVATAINNGALPASVLTGSRLLDTNGHDIELSAVSLNGVMGGGAKVTFQSMSSGVCTGVVTGLYSRMEQILVNGQTVKEKGSALLDPKTVVAACSASDAPSLALVYANAGALSGVSANGGDPGLGTDRSGTPPPPGTGGTDPEALPDLALQQRAVAASTAPLQATPEGCHTNTDAACSTPTVEGSQAPAATVGQAQSGYQNNAGGFGGAPSVH
jgi:prepilin-type N-terminal cleavage/methylation domain-containing protein